VCGITNGKEPYLCNFRGSFTLDPLVVATEKLLRLDPLYEVVLTAVLDGSPLDTEGTLREPHVLPDLAIEEMLGPQLHEVGFHTSQIHRSGFWASARS
jgi:hypothetical protein